MSHLRTYHVHETRLSNRLEMVVRFLLVPAYSWQYILHTFSVCQQKIWALHHILVPTSMSFFVTYLVSASMISVWSPGTKRQTYLAIGKAHNLMLTELILKSNNQNQSLSAGPLVTRNRFRRSKYTSKTLQARLFDCYVAVCFNRSNEGSNIDPCSQRECRSEVARIWE